mgnify:CR=1 FL=1
MVKQIVAHAVVGGVIFFVGALLHDLTSWNELGDFLAIGGIWYAAISLSMFVIPLYKKIKPQIDAAANERSRTRAYDDLIRLKKLLDEEIISQQEYDEKANELKVKFL